MRNQKSKVEEHLNLSLRKNDLITTVLFYVKTEGLTHSEALLEVCEENNIDPEDIARLVTGPLKEKLKIEALNRNIIKGGTKINSSSIIEDCL